MSKRPAAGVPDPEQLHRGRSYYAGRPVRERREGRQRTRIEEGKTAGKGAGTAAGTENGKAAVEAKDQDHGDEKLLLLAGS